eukprot:CAMPEP_0204840678 /NCGR_PEP_ID=MMETSP1346-20131115/38475_1 /ASSEMBLY_ACC=CAM_ASM_000771 /TAXON_ID=215587 /ORGANISM="Aplanochytrium stocchinoi, Strain GSBS06" /LENGTH=333 /DNA_ID=CAMNT_0051978223 /DNA_START=85 /DNA_END=1086 /DNA_ORIENTATION=+
MKASKPNLKNLKRLVGVQDDVSTCSSEDTSEEHNPILEPQDSLGTIRLWREEAEKVKVDISQNTIQHKETGTEDISNAQILNSGNQIRNKRLWVKYRKERMSMYRKSYKREGDGKRHSLQEFPVAKHEHQTREELTRDLKRFLKVFEGKMFCKNDTRGDVWKARKVILYKYSVLPGTLSIFSKSKSRKAKLWMEFTVDHTVIIEMKEATTSFSNKISEQLKMHTITVTEVKTGRTVQFYFSNVYESTAFYYELRRSQVGFFGNDVLDETTRQLLGEIDRGLMNGKLDMNEIFKAFHYRKNSNPNPLFDQPKSKFQEWMHRFHSSRRTKPMVDI